MNRKILTPDELVNIRQNYYVKSATSNSKTFIQIFII
jgi:hypothetical protein